MKIFTFFLRRLVSALVARQATNLASSKMNLSPGAANLLFIVLTEIMARGSERNIPKPSAARV